MVRAAIIQEGRFTSQGVRQWRTRSLRDLLKDQGIEVLSVNPGPIATQMGDDAGLTEIAEPPELVAEAIVQALRNGDFHVFPDSMAKQIGQAYHDFATSVIEAEMSEVERVLISDGTLFGKKVSLERPT